MFADSAAVCEITGLSSLLHPGRVIALARAAKAAGWTTTMSNDYPALVSELLTLLVRHEIPFVVVGGIALLQHVPGRNTEDIDLIISAPRLAEIEEFSVAERTELFAYGKFRDELRVDVLFAEHPVFDLVATQFSAPMQYQIGSLRTATIEGLILLKLFALPSLYRNFDHDRIAIYEADIMQLLARSRRDDNFFLELLAPHILETDRRELARILGDVRTRLARIKPA